MTIFLSKKKYCLDSIKFYFSSEETINLYSVRKMKWDFVFGKWWSSRIQSLWWTNKLKRGGNHCWIYWRFEHFLQIAGREVCFCALVWKLHQKMQTSLVVTIIMFWIFFTNNQTDQTYRKLRHFLTLEKMDTLISRL